MLLYYMMIHYHNSLSKHNENRKTGLSLAPNMIPPPWHAHGQNFMSYALSAESLSQRYVLTHSSLFTLDWCACLVEHSVSAGRRSKTRDIYLNFFYFFFVLMRRNQPSQASHLTPVTSHCPHISHLTPHGDTTPHTWLTPHTEQIFEKIRHCSSIDR
jgi:hypothetical protein